MSAWNFEPDAVRASLPALQLGQAPPPRTEAQQAYLTHYGIDLTAGYPGLSHHLGTLAAPDRRFVRYPRTDIVPLVIQGQNDRTVDWRYNLRIIKRLFVPRIVYLPTARHHLVNESPVIRQQFVEVITQELA